MSLTPVSQPNTFPYTTVGLLEVAFNDGKVCYGAGSLIDSRHILTCAHNLESKTAQATSAYFYPGYSSKNPPTQNSGVAAIAGFCPGNYIVTKIKEGKSIVIADSSWDIAVYRLGNAINLPAYMQPQIVYQGSDIQGKEMLILGYPEDQGFKLCAGKDTINGVDINLNAFSYEHQTNPGSSGSPLFTAASQNELKVYGVHIARSLSNEEDRIGVLLTQATSTFVGKALKMAGPFGKFINYIG